MVEYRETSKEEVMARNDGERCDHCKQWVSVDGRSKSGAGLFTLEGIVSPEVDINFAICSKCFERKGSDSAYWDAWVAKT